MPSTILSRYTDQKPFTVTDQDLKLPWGCGRDGIFFRCYLCGHRFQAGDVARWVFTNDVPGASGNPLVCEKCDGTKEEIVAKWKQMHIDATGKMWWFCRINDPKAL